MLTLPKVEAVGLFFSSGMLSQTGSAAGSFVLSEIVLLTLPAGFFIMKSALLFTASRIYRQNRRAYARYALRVCTDIGCE